MGNGIGTTSELSPHLAERARAAVDRPLAADGTFILYWMRTVVCVDENPALDAALEVADRVKLPVFIYHGLSELYPFAPDRHHRFIMEGARDVHAGFLQRGIGYAFHLERPGHRGPHLRSLVEHAALVVTEEMPVRPLRQWTERLAESVSTPVWLVDTACVVPMRLASQAYDRALVYRRATSRLRAERVSLDWSSTEVRHPPFTPQLPFEPVDLLAADLAFLVAECEIDHTVGPVSHSPGGSTAGYDRWDAFKRQGLERYAAQRNDTRPSLFTRETLARARTGDSLWDAAQRSLLIHGELHNNVRMTWGKAILSWTPSADHALKTLIDLNHRYALDGRDPNSYGGILWCLGQFDRPFTPERPILGSVRPRPTSSHSLRLDVERYASETSRPTAARRRRVAVVGAGVSGLICAGPLADHGLEVVVFDKGGRPGGRLATRKAEAGEYDHGAQYFTVRDPRFEARVASWREDGLVAQWRGRIIRVDGNRRTPVSTRTRRFVGVPGMNSIAAHLAADLDIRSRVQVRSVTRRNGQWFLPIGVQEEGPFDSLVLAVPAPQAVPLLETLPELKRQAESVRMNPCWAVLVSFPSAIDTEFDGALVDGGPLSWASRNASKPGRRAESWVLHASHDWSAEHLEDAPQLVIDALLEAFAVLAQCALPRPIDLQAHRWRYALSAGSLPAPCLSQRNAGIVVCGDWCSGTRVEDAFLSGSAAAGRLLGWIESTDPVENPSLF